MNMKLIRNPWFWCLWAGLIAIVLIWSAYRLNWPGTGFQGKTVWDWLSLLIIPLALALVALFFNQMSTSTERQIATQRYEQDQQIALDKQREDLLQAYLDRMSDLLLEKGLRTSATDTEVRNVARTRTISVLRQLDTRRVGDVFTFLREAGLTDAADPIISLKGANLSGVQWERARLIEADLRGADLSSANLSRASLHKANLSGANLHEANLCKASLGFANLNGADLSRANLHRTNLYGALQLHFFGETLC